MKFIQLIVGLFCTLSVFAYESNLRTESTTCVCTTVPCPVAGDNKLTEGNHQSPEFKNFLYFYQI